MFRRRCVKDNKEWELTEEAIALIQMHELMEGDEKIKKKKLVFFLF